MDEKTVNKIEYIRAQTRAAAFLIPLITLCIGLFVLTEIQDTIVGAIITAATAASIFYFKRQEEPDKEPTKDDKKDNA